MTRINALPVLFALAALCGPASLTGCTAANPDYRPITIGTDGDGGTAPPADFSAAPGTDGSVMPQPDLRSAGDLAVPSTITFVALDASWRYLDNGSDQGVAWRAPGFNDGAWKSGPAELGYGDNDEATMVGYGPNANAKYITTYFRAAFDTTFASRVTKLALRVRRDDGVIIYLNGVEVVRDNMPMGNVTFTTLASANVNGTDEMTLFPFTLNPKSIVDGHNVIAAEIHQVAANSSDISFALDLVGMTN